MKLTLSSITLLILQKDRDDLVNLAEIFKWGRNVTLVSIQNHHPICTLGSCFCMYVEVLNPFQTYLDIVPPIRSCCDRPIVR